MTSETQGRAAALAQRLLNPSGDSVGNSPAESDQRSDANQDLINELTSELGRIHNTLQGREQLLSAASAERDILRYEIRALRSDFDRLAQQVSTSNVRLTPSLAELLPSSPMDQTPLNPKPASARRPREWRKILRRKVRQPPELQYIPARKESQPPADHSKRLIVLAAAVAILVVCGSGVLLFRAGPPHTAVASDAVYVPGLVQYMGWGTVEANGAAMRRTPELRDMLVARLDAGTRIDVVGRVMVEGHQWLRVQAKGRTGYVNGDDISLN